MAIVLTVENGTGLHNANAYVSVEDCNAFNNERPYATSWLAVGLEDKKRAIIMATRLLDEHIDWYGQSKRSHNLNLSTAERQALSWPRSGVSDSDGYTVDQDTIPTWLKSATSEFARFLALEDRTVDPQRLGFQRSNSELCRLRLMRKIAQGSSLAVLFTWSRNMEPFDIADQQS